MRGPLLCAAVLASGCAVVPPAQPPQWNQVTEASEQEYLPYLATGNGVLTGQAFLTQRGGGVVKAAGRNVTLDPATAVGNEWWGKAGVKYPFASLTPPSPNFHKARKTAVADAEGRFKFTELPEGTYYVRTEVTWEAGTLGLQGGLVGAQVHIRNNKATEVILNQFAQ